WRAFWRDNRRHGQELRSHRPHRHRRFGPRPAPSVGRGGTPRSHNHPRRRLSANVECSDTAQSLQDLHPATTLVTVVSKTFPTQETMANATAAREWLRASLGPGGDQHLLAVSANPEAVAKFGVSPERLFAFRDWV